MHLRRTPLRSRPLAAALLALLLQLPGLAIAIPEGPEYPSAEWTLRETENFARMGAGVSEPVSNPALGIRWTTQSLANFETYLQRSVDDPSWTLSGAANVPVAPLCSTWSLPCTGDPFIYPDVDPVYDEADVVPVVFYDRECARLSGRVWAPKTGNGRPGIVIINGSIQAPETLYWWAAKLLVRAGYTVMTFDPRGQGRSDNLAPGGEPGTNLNPSVFWEGLVDAIDFFRSSSVQPYPHNQTCADTYPTVVTAFNPLGDRLDPSRLGIAGHSMGAAAVSIVQGYGATGADPWPGLLDSRNPVDAAVAWDALGDPEHTINANGLGALPSDSSGDLLDGSLLVGTPLGDFIRETPGIDALLGGFTATPVPAVVPRVPALGFTSEYGFAIGPYTAPPDPERFTRRALAAWQTAGIPAAEIVIAGSTHLDFSLLPTFPATSWCPETIDNACAGGWGRPMIEHYTLAWFDRWLKRDGEAGYADADARLLADTDWQARYSFYYRSARAFPDRSGKAHVCTDIRAGCADLSVGADGSDGSDGGGAIGWPVLLLGTISAVLRRRRLRCRPVPAGKAA